MAFPLQQQPAEASAPDLRPPSLLPPADLQEQALGLVQAARELCEEAAEGWRLLPLDDAAGFAEHVEQLSRSVDMLQLTAAAALDGGRPADNYGRPKRCARTGGVSEATGGGEEEREPGTAGVRRRAREFRSTADFMRARLRISRSAAKRRLAAAAALFPATSPAGEPLASPWPQLADACRSTEISASGAATVLEALGEAQPRLAPEALADMEAQLTEIAAGQDEDFLHRAARYWVALADQDRPPTEQELQQFQGIFPGRRRNGLSHLHIYCTDDQHEALQTLINSAAGAGRVPQDPGLPRMTRPQLLLEGLLSGVRAGLACGGVPAAGGLRPQVMVTISHRSLLDGLITSGADGGVSPALAVPPEDTALSVGAMSPGNATAAGGAPSPEDAAATAEAPPAAAASPTGTPSSTGAASSTGTASSPAPPSGAAVLDPKQPRPAQPGTGAFSGPLPASAIRRLACDAELIPVLLGTEGRVLDVGRSARLFPPHLRKALHARDRGCTFPGCTVPGPWTEAHHVTFWESGGSTGTENGALLCSFHHHTIHDGNWRVVMRAGVPWFVPPPYVDPRQRPLRNLFFHAGEHSGI